MDSGAVDEAISMIEACGFRSLSGCVLGRINLIDGKRKWYVVEMRAAGQCGPQQLAQCGGIQQSTMVLLLQWWGTQPLWDASGLGFPVSRMASELDTSALPQAKEEGSSGCIPMLVMPVGTGLVEQWKPCC